MRAVLLDALLRVVGSIPDEFHPIVSQIAQPVSEVDVREPGAPSDGQELLEPSRVDEDEDQDGDENDPVDDLGAECRRVLRLKGIEEAPVPVVQQLQHVDDEDVHGEDQGEDQPPEPPLADREAETGYANRDAILREPVGLRERPELGEEAARCGEPQQELVDHRVPRSGFGAFFAFHAGALQMNFA